MAGTSSGPV
jgi:hypothetical protein